MTAKVPAWPLTSSPLLHAFKAAMQRRSKALRHQLSEWQCARATDEHEGRCIESLTVFMATCNCEFRVQLWHDGVLWFHVRELRAQRKVFELSFHGSMRSASPTELLQVIEASLVPGVVRASPQQAERELLRVWARFAPSTE